VIRILSLNLWGGRVLGPLLDFVRERASHTDIFCFQEVPNADEVIPLVCEFRATLLAELTQALPEFDGRFNPMVTWCETTTDGRSVMIPFGLAMFARRTLPITARHALTVVKHMDNLDAVIGLHQIRRPLQLIQLDTSGGPLLVANYHGIARPGDKLDTAERLAQSHELRRVLAEHPGPVILIGDFNLLPDTESIHLLEHGYRNLVIERAIPTTRSRLNPYYGTAEEQPHADYAFISPGLTVVDLQVPDVEVSDHLPLLLEVGW
jgi:endonuclease/exonuclease/phosphatase family metal-dependent hydrolase